MHLSYRVDNAWKILFNIIWKMIQLQLQLQHLIKWTPKMEIRWGAILIILELIKPTTPIQNWVKKRFVQNLQMIQKGIQGLMSSKSHGFMMILCTMTQSSIQKEVVKRFKVIVPSTCSIYPNCAWKQHFIDEIIPKEANCIHQKSKACVIGIT